MATWRQLFLAEAREREDYSLTVAFAPDDPDVWDAEFDNGYGGSEGGPVLAWTQARVYFPVVYDGAEWIGSAPRNPTLAGQAHVGGE